MRCTTLQILLSTYHDGGRQLGTQEYWQENYSMALDGWMVICTDGRDGWQDGNLSHALKCSFVVMSGVRLPPSGVPGSSRQNRLKEPFQIANEDCYISRKGFTLRHFEKLPLVFISLLVQLKIK
jgi:hypothetical protein